MKAHVQFDIEIENPKDLHEDELYPIHWMVENPERAFEMLDDLLTTTIGKPLNDKAIKFATEARYGLGEMLANREEDARAEAEAAGQTNIV